MSDDPRVGAVIAAWRSRWKDWPGLMSCDDLLGELASEALAAADRAAWRPIETAPMDGTQRLVREIRRLQAERDDLQRRIREMLDASKHGVSRSLHDKVCWERDRLQARVAELLEKDEELARAQRNALQGFPP